MLDTKIDPANESDEISLGDISKFLTDHWKKILSLSVLGASLGFGYGLSSTPIYEATGNIQVGRVSNVEFETPALVLTKLAMPTYYSEETVSACGLSNQKNPREVLIKKIKPALNKSAPIITISFRHGSVELAKQCLNSILKDVRSNQSDPLNAMIKVQQDQLNSMREKLIVADNISKILEYQVERQSKLNANQEKMMTNPDYFIYSISKKSELDLLVYLINKKSELEDLRVKVNDLTAQLSPPKTTESNFVTPVYASDIPVNPSPLLIGLLSGLGACVLSIIYLLAKNMLRRSRAQSEATYS